MCEESKYSNKPIGTKNENNENKNNETECKPYNLFYIYNNVQNKKYIIYILIY